MIRRWVVLAGRVQGVGFRYSCLRMAESQNLTGWCRNLADGRVEACFEGPEEVVERAVAWCRRGPSRAVVHDVEVIPEPVVGESGFRLG